MIEPTNMNKFVSASVTQVPIVKRFWIKYYIFRKSVSFVRIEVNNFLKNQVSWYLEKKNSEFHHPGIKHFLLITLSVQEATL